MSRYPFMECVNEYVPTIDGHIEQQTYKVRLRRLKQISKILEEMMKDEQYNLSTTNPKIMTDHDIKEFVKFRRKHDIAAVTILDDLTILRELLEYFDNFSVTRFKSRNLSIYPRKYRHRPKQLPPTHYRMIVDRANELIHGSQDNWTLIRAYAVVMWPLMAGLRPQEVQKARASYVDIVDDKIGLMQIWLEHVKGRKTYGEPRFAPVLPEGFAFCKYYLNRRKEELADLNIRTDALIPKILGEGEYLSYQQINERKTLVEEDLGIEFSLTVLRHTWVQQLKKKYKIVAEDASLAGGHNNTRTTENYYYRKENEDAVEDIMEAFKEGKSEGKNSENWEKSVKNELKSSIPAKSLRLKSEIGTSGSEMRRTGRDSNPRPAA